MHVLLSGKIGSIAGGCTRLIIGDYTGIVLLRMGENSHHCICTLPQELQCIGDLKWCSISSIQWPWGLEFRPA